MKDYRLFLKQRQLTLHLQEWPGQKRPFVLIHGLSSNARTWSAVAEALAQAGHRVICLDQRGHGLSDKPESGYDFASVSADLAALIETLALEKPILAGQSWGGNVLLAFGANYPGLAHGLAFVDGGYIDLKLRPKATWEGTLERLRPPNFSGRPRSQLKQNLKLAHPDWTEAGIEATLHNFETLPDGTIRPWLSLSRHEQILRAMWTQTPSELYPQVTDPVLICVARGKGGPDRQALKAREVSAAEQGLQRVELHYFENSDHDLHVQHPQDLAQLFLTSLKKGIWAG